MNAVRWLTCFAVLGFSCAISQEPFLLTESAATLGKAKMNVGVGFEYLQKNKAPSAEGPRSLFRAFLVSLHQGVADNVNFDLTWRGGLFANPSRPERNFDWGDFSVWTKISLLKERDSFPSIGLRSGIKLPNTRYAPSRLGTNQMDFHSQLLVTGRKSDIEIRTVVGFSILGDPRTAGFQDDVYKLQTALIIPALETTTTFFELIAQTGYQDHDDKLVSRFGIMQLSQEFVWYLFCSARLAGNNRDFATAFELSENWSIGFFVQKDLEIDLWD